MARELAPKRTGDRPETDADGIGADDEPPGRSNDGEEAEPTETGLVRRREYLLAGAAAVLLPAAASGSSSAAVTHLGVEYAQELNAVADLGMDPNGGRSVQGILEDAPDDTLIRFPAGEYLFTGYADIDRSRLGLVADGDVRFTVPSGYSNNIIVGVLQYMTWEGIDIDQTASDAAPGMWLRVAKRLEMNDIEYIGRGVRYGKGEHYMLAPEITDPDGVGIIRRLTSKKGARIDGYKGSGGRMGIYCGDPHEGTLRLVDPDLREFGNNSIYASHHAGNVQVLRGYFENNSPASIRISGKGSWAKGTTIVLDMEKYTGPDIIDDDYHSWGPRAVWIEAGAFSGLIEPGALVEDCDITFTNVRETPGVIRIRRTGGGAIIRNTRIRNDAPDTRSIYSQEPTGQPWHDRDPPQEPHEHTIENVHISGAATNTAAIEFDDRDDSVISGCCIEMTGSGTDGIVLNDSDGCVIEDTSIVTTGRETVFNNSNVQTKNLTNDGTCTIPSTEPEDGSGNPDEGSRTATPTPTETPTATPTPNWDHTVAITKDGADDGVATYELRASEAVGPGDDFEDTISGDTATGRIGPESGTDSVRVAGDVVVFELDGPARVLVDGAEVDPDSLGLPHRLSVTKDGAESGVATYELTASEALAPASDFEDSLSGLSASGRVGPDAGTDSVYFGGELTDFVLDGPARVILDGVEVDPVTLEPIESDPTPTATGTPTSTPTPTATPTSTETGTTPTSTATPTSTPTPTPEPELPNTLSIRKEGTDYGVATYSITVSEALQPGGDFEDSLSGLTASGRVGPESGTDSVHFAGEVTDFSLDGPARLFLNGEEVDPWEVYDRDLPHVLTVVGFGTSCTYEFTVSGDVEPNPDGGSYDTSDNISGSAAEGAVTDGTDSYEFSGEVVSFTRTGDAAVFLDGDQVNPEKLGTDEDPRLLNEVVFDGTGTEGVTDYTLSVTGDIERSPDLGTIELADTLDGGTVTGTVEGEIDAYRFSGNLTSLQVQGDASVSFEDLDG